VPGLGFEFARAVDSAVAQAMRMPLAHPRIGTAFRHVVLRRFPYSIIYHATDTELIVVSCFHHRRRPGSWRTNLEER
jgi:plasmid stabilization system protein ParE